MYSIIFKVIFFFQVRGETGKDEDGEYSSRTTDALSRRLRRWAARKEAERKREAVVLCPVAKDDQYLVWVGEEDIRATQQWQPLRSITNPEAAEAQPDRVVFWEDIKPYVFCVQTSSGRALIVAALLREAGLHLPLCIASHSSFCLLESEMAYGFGNNFPCSFLLGGGVPGFEIPPCTVASAFAACDQPVWVSKELLLSKTRQAFTRNALHALVATSSLKETDPGLLVHLQCTLLVYEGLLLGSSNKGETNIQAVPDEEDAAVERVARSLLQASEGSKTDLRIWAAYVRMLEARRKRKEALRVACVALSTTFSTPTPLPSQYAKHAPCLFWLAFRLKLGLALCSISVVSSPKKMKTTTRNAVLELLVGMAEGSYRQASMKRAAASSSSSRKEGGSTSNHHHLQIPPTRLLAARQGFMELIGTALNDVIGSDDVAGDIHLDSTPPLFYYAAAFAWFQLLTLGVNEAMEAMGSVLKRLSIPSLSVSDNWEVQADYGVRSICLSRCHRALCELLKCAVVWNMYGSPQAIRRALLAGLQHFPCDPALLFCFAKIEMYSYHNHVVSGYISKAQHSIRREDWTAGPSAQEWAFFLSVELTRCAAQAANALGLAAAGGGENLQAEKLCWDVSLWTRGSVARLRRFFERALGDPTGHGLAFLWRSYIQTEVGAGCHSRAKRLYLRAVHACPGCKELWLDGARTGLLRETLRSEELHDFISASIEKGVFWRAPIPFENDV